MWDIHGRVDKVIAYAINLVKTENTDYEEIANLHCIDKVIKYAADDMKTEEKYFVTGLNCDVDTAAEHFKSVKAKYGKTGGIVAQHGYQSFLPNEVDAKTAHKIGVELAETLWGDRFEVIVATHCNTNCFHNHFVINSVSVKDGKKFCASEKTYYEMRMASDRICREHGLNVIYDPKGGRVPYNAWKAEQEGKLTKFDLYRRDVDAAILGSVTIREFVKRMAAMNYEVVLQGKYARFREVGREKFHRFYKLGENYTLDAIEDRIACNNRGESPFDNAEVDAPEYEPQDEQAYKKDIHLLYVHYNFELSFFLSHPYALKRVHPAIREDAKNMERISKQTVFLAKTKIKTMEDLETYKAESEAEMQALSEKRQTLQNQLKREIRVGDDVAVDKTKAELSALTLRMKELRGEVGLCDGIAARSSSMTECISYMVKERETERKEKNIYEPIQRSGRTDRANESERRGSRSETDRKGFA